MSRLFLEDAIKLASKVTTNSKLNDKIKTILEKYQQDLELASSPNTNDINSIQFLLRPDGHGKTYGSITLTPTEVNVVYLNHNVVANGNVIRHNNTISITETEEGNTIETLSTDLNEITFGHISNHFSKKQLQEINYDPTLAKINNRKEGRIKYTTSTMYDKNGNAILHKYSRELTERQFFKKEGTSNPEKYIEEGFATMKDDNGNYFTVYHDKIKSTEKFFTGEQSFNPDTNEFKNLNTDKEIRSLTQTTKDPIKSYFLAINNSNISENTGDTKELEEMILKQLASMQNSENTSSAPQLN